MSQHDSAFTQNHAKDKVPFAL